MSTATDGIGLLEGSDVTVPGTPVTETTDAPQTQPVTEPSADEKKREAGRKGAAKRWANAKAGKKPKAKPKAKAQPSNTADGPVLALQVSFDLKSIDNAMAKLKALRNAVVALS